jgi:hypothetical protein
MTIEDSPAVAVLSHMIADGFVFRLGVGDVVQVNRPAAVSEDRRALLRQHADDVRTIVGLLVCDDGIEMRLRTFRALLDGATSAIPALALIPDAEVRRGLCPSCGVEVDGVGCCWRCAVARRLAMGAPVSRTMSHTHTNTLTHTDASARLPPLESSHATKDSASDGASLVCPTEAQASHRGGASVLSA